jgi:hypothetical protein
LTLGNYLKYPDVIPLLMQMLGHPKINPEVYELILSLLKSLILKSIQGEQDKKEILAIASKSQDMPDSDDEARNVEHRELEE